MSGRLYKPGRKIAGIAKTNFLCDLADAVVGENKQLLCLCDAEVDEVVVRRCAHITPEQPQKITLAHVGIRQQVGKGKLLLVIFTQGFHSMQDHLPCAGGFGFGKNALCAQGKHFMESQPGLHHAVHGAALHLR